MNENYDRHDFLRIAIPGYIFLLVLWTYWVILNNNIKFDDPKSLIGVLAAGFPIGFIIQGIYQAWHIKLGDLDSLDGWEGECLVKALKAKNEEGLLKKICAPKFGIPEFRKISWSLETFLFLKEEEEYRKRSHELVSRIHSFGAACCAVLIAVLISLFVVSSCYDHCLCCLVSCTVGLNILVDTFFWGVVVWCFIIGRNHTKEVFRLMFWNFIQIKSDKFIKYIKKDENNSCA